MHPLSFLGADDWRRRLNSGFVVGSDGAALDEHSLFEPGKTMFYYRETGCESEPRIPFEEKILFVDEHLIVVDKPHFLPVIPGGRFCGNAAHASAPASRIAAFEC